MTKEINYITPFPEPIYTTEDLDDLRTEYIELYEKKQELEKDMKHDPNNKFLKNTYYSLVDTLQINIFKRGYIEKLMEEGML